MQGGFYPTDQAKTQVRVNEFVRGVYNWMAIGLALTGTVAYFTVNNPTVFSFVLRTFIILVIAELALVFSVSARIQKMKATTATALFLIYSALNGATLSILLARYAQATIASAFFICAASFLALSIFGWTTKRDLTGFGSFLFMGLVGIVIASVINIFLGSYGIMMIVSYIGVLVFAGLTAYDTQKLKMMALSQPAGLDASVVRKGTILGALQLYLDFILMFQYLLIILGNNRR